MRKTINTSHQYIHINVILGIVIINIKILYVTVINDYNVNKYILQAIYYIEWMGKTNLWLYNEVISYIIFYKSQIEMGNKVG